MSIAFRFLRFHSVDRSEDAPAPVADRHP